MSDGKWEAKNRAAKEAEAKFEANQARAAQQSKQSKKKERPEEPNLDSFKIDVGVGPLGWLIAHKWMIGVLVALLAGGVVFVMCKVVKHQLRNAPGSPRAELLVEGTLILIDHVSVGGSDSKGRAQQTTAEGERLTAIDVATGEQLAVDVSDYKACHAGGARLACIDIYDQLDLLDPKTLTVTHRAAELIAAAKLAKPTRRIEQVGGSFIVVLEDGRGAQIDPASATVTTLETVSTQADFSWSSSGCSTMPGASLDGTTLVLDTSGTRSKLTTNPPPPAESATPSGPALSFLEGRFLAIAGPPLVLHRVTLDKPEHLISRIGGIAKEAWQVPLEGECRNAWAIGSTLVVATGNPKRRAVGIDLASGRVAWEFGR